jgi:hypothetical protein
MQEEKPDRFDVAAGAQKMAYRTVIQALVESASATDPDLRDRIARSVEAYLTRLGPQSELERDFAEQARASVEALIQPPVS